MAHPEVIIFSGVSLLFSVLLDIKAIDFKFKSLKLSFFKLILCALEEYMNPTGCHVAIISTSFPLSLCFYSKESRFSFTGRKKSLRYLFLIKNSFFLYRHKWQKKCSYG